VPLSHQLATQGFDDFGVEPIAYSASGEPNAYRPYGNRFDTSSLSCNSWTQPEPALSQVLANWYVPLAHNAEADASTIPSGDLIPGSSHSESVVSSTRAAHAIETAETTLIKSVEMDPVQSAGSQRSPRGRLRIRIPPLDTNHRPRRRRREPRSTCANCGQSFSRAADLRRHQNDVHELSQYSYHCIHPDCPYMRFARLDKVLEHCQNAGHGGYTCFISG
jgi:hypothetical protein